MASGDTLAVFEALAARPPTTAYPQVDLRNGHVVLDFDDTTAEEAYFLGLLSSSYAGGDLVVHLAWTPTSATSGDVRWEVAWERHFVNDTTHGTLDLDVDDFGDSVGSTSSAQASAGQLARTTLTIPVSSAKNPNAGDSYRLRVKRLADAAADTLLGDAELFTVELREG